LKICLTLRHYENIAQLLANKLPHLELESEPLDVAETLELLSDEMEDMPSIIQDCRQATSAFGDLEEFLDRMYSLADRAVAIGERDPSALALLDHEFSGYAHLIARLAGEDDFSGPTLSLGTVSEARVARVILGCLASGREKLSKRLEIQRRNINLAMDEALGLLRRILLKNMEISAETRETLTDILGAVGGIEEEYREEEESFRDFLPTRYYLN
jgi:hypothetical protein